MRVYLLLLTLAWAADPRELGRKYQQQLEAGDAEGLWPHLSPEMQKVFGGSPAAMKTRLQEIRQLNGDEVQLTEELLQWPPGGMVYARKARFEKNYVQYVWFLDANGLVTGMKHVLAPPDGMAGEAPTKYLDYQTKTKLQLPFRGSWRVFWGGRTVKENRHATASDQRFAYDFDVTKNGADHLGEGTKNEQYHCFGQPLLAPGAGKVALAVDGIDDNVPGKMPEDHPCGNHVILDHGNGEYSYLCHMQKGSLRVNTGAQVKAGEPIGKCGNSGSSSQPHLHYDLETSPHEYQGVGLPAQFLDYSADGKRVPRGEPVRGQTISREP